MLTVYVACGVVGLTLLILSLFTGDHSDAGVDHDASLDLGQGLEAGLPHPAEHGWSPGHPETGGGPLWLPFLSLRFWTAFLAVFGSLGTLLTLQKLAGPAATLGWSALGGAVSGTLVAYALRALQRGDDPGVSEGEFLGKEGRLLVATGPNRLGKVRVEAKGEIIDLVALSEGDQVIEAGESVIVVGLDGSRARVLRTRDLLDDV